MKKLKVIKSKSTGFTYLEADTVKKHIDALEIAIEEMKTLSQLDMDSTNQLFHAMKKRMDKIDNFNNIVVKKILDKVDEKIPTCMNCGKPMKNVKDTTTGKISKYLWHCTCWKKGLTLSMG